MSVDEARRAEVLQQESYLESLSPQMYLQMEKSWQQGFAQYGELWKKLAPPLPLPSGIGFSTHFLTFGAVCRKSMPPSHMVSQDTSCFLHKPLESRQDIFTKIFQTQSL